MAMGVAELKRELQEGVGLLELPEIHQFLDGFYLSRIGIRILIGQHIALHEPEQENYIGKSVSFSGFMTMPALLPFLLETGQSFTSLTYEQPAMAKCCSHWVTIEEGLCR